MLVGLALPLVSIVVRRRGRIVGRVRGALRVVSSLLLILVVLATASVMYIGHFVHAESDLRGESLIDHCVVVGCLRVKVVILLGEYASTSEFRVTFMDTHVLLMMPTVRLNKMAVEEW